MAYINSLRTPEWLKKRNEIYTRDQHRCVICGSKENLSIHHLYYLPETMPWEYDNEGLITVCNDHHKVLNFELPKLSGIIAFKIINCEIDLKDIMV